MKIASEDSNHDPSADNKVDKGQEGRIDKPGLSKIHVIKNDADDSDWSLQEDSYD